MLLFMRRIARMTRLAPVVVDVQTMSWFCALLARCFLLLLKLVHGPGVTS